MNYKSTFRNFCLPIVLLTTGFNVNAQQPYYNVQEVTTSTPSRVWLDITGPNGGVCQAAIAYLPQGTLGLDFGYDAEIFPEANTIALYTIAQNVPLVIQARPSFSNYDVVQVGYIAPQAGNYTISINHKDGIFNNGQHIYVKDTTTGVISDLNSGALFFTSNTGTFNDRFQVVYIDTTLGTDQPQFNNNSVVVARSAQALTVSAGSNIINYITIYDLNGRKIYSSSNINLTEANINDLTASKQLVIVEVNTTKGTVSKKVVY